MSAETPDQHVEVPVPEEVVEAIERVWRACPDTISEGARASAEAAAPFIAAKAVQQERERLLSKKALQAAADKFSGFAPADEAERNEVRIEFKAAFAALDQEGDGDE